MHVKLLATAFLIATLASAADRCGSCERDPDGRIHRSSAARAEFRRDNPRPSTGLKRGACPGFVIDHIRPLACKGEDAPSNMQWQSKAEAKAKDRWELRACAASH
jgi:hypothetical protein